MYASARTLRFADGPDEVHRNQIGQASELGARRMPRDAACDALPRACSLHAERLHLPFWPAHAPSTCRCPRRTCSTTSRSRRRAFRDKPFIVFYDTPISYARLQATRPSASPASCSSSCGVQDGRPRAAVHAEQPAVHDRLLRHPARRCGGGAGQPDEPDARSCAHYVQRQRRHRSRSPRRSCWPQHRSRCCGRGPRAHRGRPPTATTCAKPTDLTVPDVRGRAARSAASPGLVALWPTRWRAAWRRGPHRRPAPTTSRVMPYTSGTTGQPKGCMHTHRSVMSNAVAGVLWFSCATRTASGWRCCRCST